jgi:hypothetical protein
VTEKEEEKKKKKDKRRRGNVIRKFCVQLKNIISSNVSIYQTL